VGVDELAPLVGAAAVPCVGPLKIIERHADRLPERGSFEKRL
jgi:hypothetical protein